MVVVTSSTRSCRLGPGAHNFVGATTSPSRRQPALTKGAVNSKPHSTSACWPRLVLAAGMVVTVSRRRSRRTLPPLDGVPRDLRGLLAFTPCGRRGPGPKSVPAFWMVAMGISDDRALAERGPPRGPPAKRGPGPRRRSAVPNARTGPPTGRGETGIPAPAQPVRTRPLRRRRAPSAARASGAARWDRTSCREPRRGAHELRVLRRTGSNFGNNRL